MTKVFGAGHDIPHGADSAASGFDDTAFTRARKNFAVIVTGQTEMLQ